jgi:hypothetical protein
LLVSGQPLSLLKHLNFNLAKTTRAFWYMFSELQLFEGLKNREIGVDRLLFEQKREKIEYKYNSGLGYSFNRHSKIRRYKYFCYVKVNANTHFQV